LRLLKLPNSVRKALASGKLREGQARPLVGLDPEIIDTVLPRILSEEWSARKIEQFIVDLKQTKKVAPTQKPVSAKHDAVVTQVAKRFGTKVQVRSNAKGAGQIVIAFKDDKDFDRISALLDQ
jgi:ParB family chromosome partitioning protein